MELFNLPRSLTLFVLLTLVGSTNFSPRAWNPSHPRVHPNDHIPQPVPYPVVVEPHPDGTNPINHPDEPASSPNPCFNERCGDISYEVAADIIQSILHSTARSTTADAATTQFPVTIGAVPTITQAPFYYPDADVASSIARADIFEPFMSLLDTFEQNMYISEPVCFYANAVRVYSSAAVRTTTTTASSPTNTTAMSTVVSTLPANDPSALQASFFATELPRQMASVYVTGAQVQTTICERIERDGSFQVVFVDRTQQTQAQTTGGHTGGVSRVTEAQTNSMLALVLGIFLLVVWL